MLVKHHYDVAYINMENVIKYKFKNPDLLRTALSHSSYTKDAHGKHNYERMEFLGDAALQLVVSEYLFERFTKEREGFLAKRRSQIVCGRSLAIIARSLNLGKYLLMSDAEEQNGGRENDTILEDAMEALIGAIYLDAGFDVTKLFILRYFEEMLIADFDDMADPKSFLQEWCQKYKKPLPEYEVTNTEGADHSPLFEITVHVEGKESVISTGTSKKKAEREAAAKFIKEHNLKKR